MSHTFVPRFSEKSLMTYETYRPSLSIGIFVNTAPLDEVQESCFYVEH